jgi:ABC-type phosphate transport system substrate-binding protein
MGFAHTQVRRGRRAGLLLAAAGAACAFLAPSSANAAFTITKCGGDATKGAGATFQNLAQGIWNSDSVWKSSDFCGSTGPAITYASIGSGGGRTALANAANGGARDDGSATSAGVRFGASDSAITAGQRTTIENGLTSTDTDNAKIHVIPVAVGAITVSVNFPDACWLDTADTDYFAPDTANDNANHTGRFKLDKNRVVKAFAGDASVDTWGELLPGITGTNAAGCQAMPITRVVRLDASGTSTVFEKWLNIIKGVGDPAFGGGTLGDRTWPNGNNDLNTNGGETTTFKRGSGNAGVAAKLNDNDGSIGYIELADARANGFNVVAAAGAAHSFQPPQNDTFWIPLPNGASPTPAQVDPTANALSYKNGVSGANCATAEFGVRPSTTSANTLDLPAAPSGSTLRSLGDDWSLVDGLNPATGYGVCTPTFELAYDDNADAFGNTDAEQKKARTVKDYLGAIVSGTGQAVLNGADYSPLPTTAPAGAPAGTPSLRQVATDAVAAIDWNKKGVGQGPSNPGPTNPGPTNPGPTNPGPTNPGPTAPSNSFSFGSGKSSSTGVITLSLTVPGAGTINTTGTTTVPAKFTKVTSAAKKAKKITFGKATVKVSKSGAVKVTLKPSSAAKKALAKGATLKVSVKITYTPTGGTAKSTTKTITVKGKKPKKK